MKIERDKKSKRKMDHNETSAVATQSVRGILKPSSHTSRDVTRPSSRGDANILLEDYTSDESTSDIEKKESSSPTLEVSKKGKHDSDKDMGSTNTGKRRVAFRNDVTVKIIQTATVEMDKAHNEGITETDSIELDNFFQSIDDIPSLEKNANLNDVGSSIIDRNTATIEQQSTSPEHQEGQTIFTTNNRQIDIETDFHGTIDDNADGEMEQAAYEARLARLILLRSQKSHSKEQSSEHILYPDEYMPTFALETYFEEPTTQKSRDKKSSMSSEEESLSIPSTLNIKDLIRTKYNKHKVETSEREEDDSYWNADYSF